MSILEKHMVEHRNDMKHLTLSFIPSKSVIAIDTVIGGDVLRIIMDGMPVLNARTAYAESLCVLTANILCGNKPLYKVKEWLSNYSDGIVDEPLEANLFNDDRLARALSALFNADRHSLMTEVSVGSA